MKRYFVVLLIVMLAAVVLVGASFCASKDQVRSMLTRVIIDKVLAKHPQYPASSVKVFFKYADSTLNSLSARADKISFDVSEMYPDFDPVGDVIIPVQVYADGAQREKIFLRSKVEIWLDVVAAGRPLKKKQRLTKDDLKLLNKDIGNLSKRFFSDIDALIGKEMVSSIYRDGVILDWMVRTPPTISKNEDVTIFVELSGVSATAKGVALEDGNMGDLIKVKNLDTKKEIKATVTGTNEVKVDLK